MSQSFANAAFRHGTARAAPQGARAEPAIVACVGVARWKREAVTRLIAPEGAPLLHTRQAGRAVRLAQERRGAIAVWPSRAPPDLPALAEATGAPLVTIEDGFIRSVGLGAECRAPASIVIDRTGVHFDPRRPSDLERLLTEARFDTALLRRAERLVDQIVRNGVTKYNLAGPPPPAATDGRRRVLVVGQVEDDLSVRFGGAGVAGNLDLLRRVRGLEPDACVLYRPHPDVDGGHRRGGVPDSHAMRFADRVVRGHDMPGLIDGVDAVHVLTSLTGFEALIRGREVIVHGQPFYAGWGLTRDLTPPPRRGRRRTLAELTAAALILYPRYLHPATGTPCEVETLVAAIGDTGAAPPAFLPALRRLQGRAAGFIGAALRPLHG